MAAHHLTVRFPPELAARVPATKLPALTALLAQDPRPAYQADPERVYGFGFAGLEIRFRVQGEELTVVEVSPGAHSSSPENSPQS